MAKKINTSMNLDEDLLKWVDSQITKKRFAHRIHAVEYALQNLLFSYVILYPCRSKYNRKFLWNKEFLCTTGTTNADTTTLYNQ